MEPPPRCERPARAIKRPATSRTSARDWAQASKLARSRRKEEAAALRLQAGDLQVRLAELERAHSEVSESDESAVSAAFMAKSTCLDQHAARLATERRNEELKATARELLAVAEKANRVFNRLLRHQRELDRLEAGQSLPPVMYDPSSDDELFQTLELRQRSQEHDVERVFRDAGISRDIATLERTELIGDLRLTTSWEGVASPMCFKLF